MTDTPGTMEERARRIVARFYQRIRDHDYAQWVMEGRKDGTNDMRLVITALTEAADEIASLRARVETMGTVLALVTDTLRRQYAASPGHASNAEKVNAALDEARQALKDTPDA